MKTFNNNKQLKQELLNQLKYHQKLDAFVQGEWLRTKEGKIDGNGFKGCFYGCTMQTESSPLLKFSEKYSIDLWYVYLTEKIFEGLSELESKKFPYEAIEIIPVGIDFNRVKSLFHYKLLGNQLQYCKRDEKAIEALKKCMELFKIPFNEITESAAKSAAESAAESARSAWSVRSVRSAWSAAESARSAAWSAAWSARSAASSAWSAAESAAESARSAAEKNYYEFIRDLLFQCIKEIY